MFYRPARKPSKVLRLGSEDMSLARFSYYNVADREEIAGQQWIYGMEACCEMALVLTVIYSRIEAYRQFVIPRFRFQSSDA